MFLLSFIPLIVAIVRILIPTYLELGKRFEKLKDYVRIAEFNMLENNLEYENINGYPTLLFYLKEKKIKREFNIVVIEV